MPYTHLTIFERQAIYLLTRQGYSRRQIANEIGRSPSTISREMKRNRGKRGYYGYQAAHKYAIARRRNARPQRRRVTEEATSLIVQMLRKLWSPQIISNRLPAHLKISHQTIYTWIYRDRPDLTKFLWLDMKKIRKRYKSRDSRGRLPDRKSIHDRPIEADERSKIGHWEGDTIVGTRHQGAVASVVDRKSRFCMLDLLEDKTSQSVTDSLIERFSLLPQRLRQTLTVDNGKEFSEHKRLARSTKMDVYFADTYASWQRGSNEQLNKLVRRWLPKKTDFRNLSKFQIAEIESLLNNRPRKCLGYLSPIEFLTQELARSRKGVAVLT